MPRRSPTGPERVRDADRTREAILDAALAEFAEHGFAGARTAAIAERAGVNQQLISYYFGGKAGLHRTVRGRWPATAAPLRDGSLAETVAGFTRPELRDWARLLVWDELTGGDRPDPDADGYYAAMADEIAARQAAGEVDPELDPGAVLLALFAAALAPQVLPGVARRLVGDDPAAYGRALAAIVEHLRPRATRSDADDRGETGAGADQAAAPSASRRSPRR